MAYALRIDMVPGKIYVGVLFLLISLSGYSQVEKDKGLSGLKAVTTFTPEQTIHEAKKRNCYVLAIGMTGPFVDGPLETLSFPDDDCKSFVESVERLFRYQYNIIQYSFQGVENSKRTYYQACNLLDKLKAQNVNEGDIVFLYFSGHGITFRDSYCFPLYDANVRRHSSMITGGMIVEVAENLANHGANVFVFLDTCSSGSISSEPVYLSGKGGLICYPATSKNSTTQERLSIGGSEFGNRIVSLLSGEGFEPTDHDEFTVEILSNSLAESMTGGVKPYINNSSANEIAEFVLVNGVSSIRRYNKLLDQYHLYINNGDSALKGGQLDVALKNYENALKLTSSQEMIFPEDIIDLTHRISELNAQIISALEEDLSSDRWKILGNIDDTNSLVDSDIDFSRLYFGCGKYYEKIGDYVSAYFFFDKALLKGDKKSAPFELFKITEDHQLPINNPLEERDRQLLLRTASENGNEEAYKLLHPQTTVKDKQRKEKDMARSPGVEKPYNIHYYVKTGVSLHDSEMFDLLGFQFSVGSYNLFGRLLMEMTMTYCPIFSVPDVYILGSDVLLGYKLTNTGVYLKIGPGVFSCVDKGEPTYLWSGSAALCYFINDRLCLEIGGKYYPTFKVANRESVNTVGSVSENNSSLTVSSIGVYPSFGLGLVF